MGFFSWKTADTEESIYNCYTDECKTVYLLHPGGDNIEEKNYGGYGEFGGKDAYEWLAENNISKEELADSDEDDRRMLGIALDIGSYYVDTEDGSKWFVNLMAEPAVLAKEGVRNLKNHTYITPIEEYAGKNANQLITSGRWEEKPTQELLASCGYNPLKFSFNKDARYEDLPASKICEKQGFFE
jgi:hypothetical protein